MESHYFTKNGERLVRSRLSIEMIAALKREWHQHVQTIRPYPDHFKGKGIVICAGGLSYFTCAWISIRKLRENGCTLPIEVWYCSKELNDETIKALEEYQVACMNFQDYGIKATIGYMLKPLAILHSRFEEVLFLDADNVCVCNPEYLFDSEAYLNNGAVFWPDYWRTPPKNPIWQITGVRQDLVQEQESGQLLINKRRGWKALNLCVFFNTDHVIYYQILMGDKDTFKFAWLALDTPFYWIGGEPSSCGYIINEQFYGSTMVQYDSSGNILFLHRNMLKWDRTPDWARNVWQKIKWFNSTARDKTYIFKRSPYGHGSLDLSGNTTMTDFREIFHNLEDNCMDILKELRASEFYKRFAASAATPLSNTFVA